MTLGTLGGHKTKPKVMNVGPWEGVARNEKELRVWGWGGDE